MKRTGKIAAAFITALTAVASITACSADYSHIEGYSDIENARKLYSSLYSAEITVTDKQTGTVTQELTFCYDKSDTLSDAKVITMQYDVSKLNSSMASQLGLVGDLDSFSVVYTIDKDGYCTSMEQTGTATKDGVQSKVDYLMTVSHMNDIASVSKPQVQESADKSDAE